MDAVMETAGANQTKNNPKKQWCFLVLIIISLLIVFSKTLFMGEPISRFNLIQQLDVLFNPALTCSDLSVAQDPSACLQSIPREFLVQDQLRELQLPLWNNLTGCGQPLLADPANTIFAPIDLLFSPQNQIRYNIGIVLKIILGAFCSYFLFLRYGAVPWAASTAALGFALCARVLRGVELATNFEMLPAIFLAFAFLTAKSSYLRISLCALALALSYVSLHPEVFFVGVCSASILWLMELFTDPKQKGAILDGLKSFLLFGALSVAMVSPFIVSFAEYLTIAQSYKYSDTSTQYITLNQLPFYFCIPKIAGTLFPGWVVLLGLVAGLMAKWKQRIGVTFVAVLCILFACRPFILEGILGKAPFAYLLPEYALGTALLLICLCSSIGLSKLAQLKLPMKMIFMVAGLILMLLPQISIMSGAKIPGIDIPLSSKLTTISFLLSAGAALLLSIPQNNGSSNQIARILALVAMFGLPLLNLGSLIAPLKAELPLTKKVKLPPPYQRKLIETLIGLAPERVTACGDRLLSPNTGIFYEMNDLRTCSPLNNSRYLKFMQKLGAKLGYCNMMQVPTELNQLLDLASVKYVVSNNPITTPNRESKETWRLSTEAPSPSTSSRILPGLRLLGAKSYLDDRSAAINCELLFHVHDNIKSRYQFQLALIDQDNKDLWTTDYKWLAKNTETNAAKSRVGAVLAPPMSLDPNAKSPIGHLCEYKLLVPAPLSIPKPAHLLMRIRDTWTGALVQPDGNGLTLDGPSILLNYDANEDQTATANDGTQQRFTVMYESPQLTRIYRNNSALPNAYLVHNAIATKSEAESLSKIVSKDFDYHNTVVLEQDKNKDLESELHTLGLNNNSNTKDNTEYVKTKHTDSLKKEYLCKTTSPGVLVLTDTYYPGWNVNVDGKPAAILRANYLFRGVMIPAGEHHVKFQYQSALLTCAFCISALAMFITFLLASFQPFRSNKNSKSSD